jgi:hypothetical protein
MAALRPNWPPGLPSPLALQTATEAMRRRYVLAATLLHPVVARQALELGYFLSAYSLVPPEPQAAPMQSDIVVDAPRKPARSKRLRGRRRAALRVPAAEVDTIADTLA